MDTDIEEVVNTQNTFLKHPVIFYHKMINVSEALWFFINALLECSDIVRFQETDLYKIFSRAMLYKNTIAISPNVLWINQDDPFILQIDERNNPYYDPYLNLYIFKNIPDMFDYLNIFYTRLSNISIQNEIQMNCLISYTSRQMKIARVYEIMNEVGILKETEFMLANLSL